MNGETGEQVKMASNEYEFEISKEQMELLSAVKTGTAKEVQDLANKVDELSKDESFDYLLLITALQRGHRSILKFLLEKVNVVKAPAEIGSYQTPLYYAVKMNDLEIFEELWKKGATIYNTDIDKMSAVELAMFEGKTAMVKLILNGIKESKESRKFIPDSKHDLALFHAACWTGDLEAIQMFKSHNFSLSSRSTFNTEKWKGFTPLHFVVEGRRTTINDLGEILKYEDIDFIAQDERGRTVLHLAFRYPSAYASIFRTMIECVNRSDGTQLTNPVDKDGLSHFHIFCSVIASEGDSARDLDIFKSYIDIGTDLNDSVSLEDQKYPGFAALHFAAGKSSWKVLKLLLEHGADPTKIDKNGSTPLHILCGHEHHERENYLKIVQLLLDHGADAVAKDAEYRTPLHVSFCAHYCVRPLNASEKILLSRNQESINHTDKYGISYLHMACTGDDLGVVEALVNNGASVNSCIKTDSRRYAIYSPLHFAVESQQVEIVEFLLTRGADVKKCVSARQTTSLHLACRFDRLHPPDEDKNKEDDKVDWLPSRSKQIRIVELLIQHGADVDARDALGSTPLLEIPRTPHILCQDPFKSQGKPLDDLLSELLTRQQKIMDILLHHGVNINACDRYGGSILHILAKNFEQNPSSKALAEIALKRGADVNAVDEIMGYTPLHVAVYTSIENELDTPFIDLLLEHGANINAKSNNLDTPLHVALQYFVDDSKAENVLSKLLDHPKIDVDASNHRKQTPLHIALDERNYFATEKLLEAGADINLEDENRNPPIYHLVKYLEDGTDDEEDEEGNKTLATVIIHVKKLKKLNFRVSSTVNSNFETISSFLTEECLTAFDNEINREVEELKAHRIDSYTSLYDILFKDSTAMAKHVNNREIQVALLLIHCHWGYTLFGDILTRQYQKGYDRSELLEPAKKALNLVTNINWPDLCSERILSNLCDDTLKCLIQCVPHDETRKRSADSLPEEEEPPGKISRCDQ